MFRLIIGLLLFVCLEIAQAQPNSRLNAHGVNLDQVESLPAVPPLDPCTLLKISLKFGTNINKYTTPSRFGSCISFFPFEPENYLPIIDTVIRGLDNFYVYKNIASESPDPLLPSRYNVISRLSKLREQAETGRVQSLYTFLTAMRRIIRTLNDGHTALVDNCLSGRATHALALPLMLVVEDGQQVVRIATRKRIIPWFPDVVAGFGIRYYDFEGKRVTHINGKPALAFVLNWADRFVLFSRDPAARAAKAFSHPGLDLYKHGEFSFRSDVPKSDFLRYKIEMTPGQRPALVHVPFITIFNGNASFSDARSYFSLHCLRPPVQPTSQRQDPPPSLKDSVTGPFHSPPSVPPPLKPFLDSFLNPQATVLRDVDPELFKKSVPQALAAADVAAEFASPNAELLNPNGFYPVYLLPDSTSVIRYHTFRNGPNSFLYILRETMSALESAKLGKRVLFDLSGNGGGYTLIAWLLVRLLVGSGRVSETDLQDDHRFLISNSVAARLYEAFAEDTGYILNATTNGPASIQPLWKARYSEDGEASYWSNAFTVPYRDTARVPFGPPFFGSRPVLLLSNGDCFSSCAIFTHVMKKRFGQKIVSVGGLVGSPSSVSSSCLGFTMDSLQKYLMDIPGVLQWANNTPIVDRRLPEPFRLNVDLGFASSALFVNGSRVPCEFVFLEGDVRLDYTPKLANEIAEVWKEAAKYF